MFKLNVFNKQMCNHKYHRNCTRFAISIIPSDCETLKSNRITTNSNYKFNEEHDNDRSCCAPVTETIVTDRYFAAKLPERFQSRGTGCSDVCHKTNNVILSSTSRVVGEGYRVSCQSALINSTKNSDRKWQRATRATHFYTYIQSWTELNGQSVNFA